MDFEFNYMKIMFQLCYECHQKRRDVTHVKELDQFWYIILYRQVLRGCETRKRIFRAGVEQCKLKC